MSKKNTAKKTSKKRVRIHAEVVAPVAAPETPEASITPTATEAAPTDSAVATETPTGAKAKKTKTAKPEPKERKPGILTIAANILKSAKKPMTTKEIVEQALAKGLWETKGKTPSATLYSAILREVLNKGDKARFARGEKHGQFCSTANA